jgi:diacylglycerol kinase family enzyme
MDGVVDVEVFACARRQAFSVMPRVVRGNHLRHPGVKRGRLTEGTISVPGRWPVEADGELLGHGSVAVGVVPGAIDFKI